MSQHLLTVREELQQNLQVTSEEEGELETISLGEVIILEEPHLEEDQESTAGVILEEAVTEEEPVQGAETDSQWCMYRSS